MLEDAHRRRVEVWALARLTREGMVATVGYLQRLASAGVAFHSYSEPALCSDNEMVRDIVLAVMSALRKALVGAVILKGRRGQASELAAQLLARLEDTFPSPV